jgi:hypothetical protein
MDKYIILYVWVEVVITSCLGLYYAYESINYKRYGWLIFPLIYLTPLLLEQPIYYFSYNIGLLSILYNVSLDLLWYMPEVLVSFYGYYQFKKYAFSPREINNLIRLAVILVICIVLYLIYNFVISFLFSMTEKSLSQYSISYILFRVFLFSTLIVFVNRYFIGLLCLSILSFYSFLNGLYLQCYYAVNQSIIFWFEILSHLVIAFVFFYGYKKIKHEVSNLSSN